MNEVAPKISSRIHTHISPPHAVCDGPEQVQRYHTPSPKLGASSLTWHVAGL
jgi:hypothetical protein